MDFDREEKSKIELLLGREVAMRGLSFCASLEGKRALDLLLKPLLMKKGSH